MTMPVMTIFLNAEEMMMDVAAEVVDCSGLDQRIGVLTAGMASGKPSVSMFFKLRDGRYAFFETSLVMFLTVADAFKAKYGDPRE